MCRCVDDNWCNEVGNYFTPLTYGRAHLVGARALQVCRVSGDLAEKIRREPIHPNASISLPAWSSLCAGSVDF